MADSAVSGLVAAASLSDADLLLISQGGVSKSLTARLLGRYVGDALHNEYFGTAQSLTASSTTYLNGSPITIPTGETVPANAWFRWNFHLTKTAAGTAACSILIKFGTAGTTADATLLTLSLTALGTAAADEADVEVIAGFRSVGSGTSAVLVGRLRMIHNLVTTGWSTGGSALVNAIAVSAGFNSTTNLSKIGLAATIGASYVATLTSMRCEAKNI